VTGQIDLRNFTFRQLEEYVAGLGHPSFRAKQIFSRLQRPGAVDFSRMKNVNRELLAVLGELAGISRLDSFAVEESAAASVSPAPTVLPGTFVPRRSSTRSSR
jgi:adenine C2-methylase RlmN of 23S rRNA A2503 and tRNA A37